MSAGYFGRAVPLTLRRFVQLPCIRHSVDRTKDGFLLPKGLPEGVHVVLLLNRRRQIEHCDSWLSVREAWERVLEERGLHVKGEMQMYICCLLPRLWPLRWMWYWRMGQWTNLLQTEDQESVHLLSTTAWAKDFHERMQIHNDGRAYALVIRNTGQILWASDDAFKEHLQQKAMVQVVNEEVNYRMEEHLDMLADPKPEGVLGGGGPGALDAGAAPVEGSAASPVAGGDSTSVPPEAAAAGGSSGPEASPTETPTDGKKAS